MNCENPTWDVESVSKTTKGVEQMNGVQVVRRSLPLTWGQIAASLTRDYGEANASKTVEYLRDREGLLNSLNQCGDLAKASLKIDGGLYAMEPEGVRTHRD